MKGTEQKKRNQPHGQRSGVLKNNNPPCELSLLPRCSATAKTTGVRCKQASMKNGKCYWHGGKSTGAPLGNKNSIKHGLYTRDALEERKLVRQLLKDCNDRLDRM